MTDYRLQALQRFRQQRARTGQVKPLKALAFGAEYLTFVQIKVSVFKNEFFIEAFGPRCGDIGNPMNWGYIVAPVPLRNEISASTVSDLYFSSKKRRHKGLA